LTDGLQYSFEMDRFWEAMRKCYKWSSNPQPSSISFDI